MEYAFKTSTCDHNITALTSSLDLVPRHFSTDQEDKVTPTFTVFRHLQNEPNQSHLLFHDSYRPFIPQPRLVSHDEQAWSYNP